MSSIVLSKVFIVYLFFFSDFKNRKLQAPGVDASNFNTEKLNECGRCKVLTDSFNHWLDKTSRGKYEGGDAAWEEAKLKSYARSEIRFVEVQEGLCSELSMHQHDCYMLAEEAEQVLEKWWFHEDPNSVDLHTWLCIETLKNCCPNSHFGESCTPCPLDKDNKICSGHGRCDGDGTRNGSGLCICNKGYIGSSCEECANNYFSFDGSCERCDQACESCSAPGPGACKTCNIGWKEDSGVCIDIDECFSPTICQTNHYCINKDGSYNCKKCDDSCQSCIGAGPLNCTSCEPTNYLWNGKCIADSLRTEILKSAVKRMTIYLGMLVALGIIHQASRRLALLAFIIFTIYIYFTEKSLEHISTYDIYFNSFGATEGAWFL